MQPTTVGPNPAPSTSPSISTITGHCLCGAVTIAVAGEHDPQRDVERVAARIDRDVGQAVEVHARRDSAIAERCSAASGD